MEDHHKFYSQGVYIPPVIILYLISYLYCQDIVNIIDTENFKTYTCTVLLFVAASIVPDFSKMLLTRFRANIELMSLLYTV